MATKSPCTNHIHFAMKKGNGFIDPTKFLEARLFKFKPWEQYCDDYLLVWKVRIFLYLYYFLVSLLFSCIFTVFLREKKL